MRNKKVLSTVVASALVATTMAMPVMAATQTGSVDVDISTKTGVLRVEVPTKMAMTIDQFEITQKGAQIASGEFNMKNRSEMDVEVVVTSTATLGSGIGLASSVKEVSEATGADGKAWLAVAAQTKAPEGSPVESVYDDATTTDMVEKYFELTEANANVATFDNTGKKAEQKFYLGKGSGQEECKLMVSKDTTATVATAQFYQLTEDTVINDDTKLQALVDSKDVYVIAATDVAKDGASVTKIAKGTENIATSNPYNNANKYFTAADTEATTITASTPYVYTSLNTVAQDGSAGFKYVGKLSNNKATWTEADITDVAIGYTITGITGTKYDEVKGQCTYGLYKEKPADVAPSIAVATATMVAGQPATFNVDLGAGTLSATGIASISNAGTTTAIPTSAYTFADGVLTITADRVNALLNANLEKKEYDVRFNDTAKTVVTITLTK